MAYEMWIKNQTICRQKSAVEGLADAIKVSKNYASFTFPKTEFYFHY